MTDLEFMDHAEQLLLAVERSCDRINDTSDADVDSQRSGGMVTLTFPNRSQIVINLQKPLHEVWMAARSGGYHYRFDGSYWQDTKGGGELVSRLGVRRKADLLIPPETDVFEAVRTANADGAPLACVLCDESQFFTAQQAEQLFMVTVDLNIPVICYGLRADFSLKGFPGSTRLLELAHTIEEMKTICTCGRKAICNCRRVNGRFVFEGEQVAIDLENDVQYVSMCPQCYFKAKRAFYAEKAASRVE